MMDELPSEVLLKMFKKLNSKEMVKVMRVCGKWFGIIVSNKSLWTSLVLPEDEGEKFQSILELFGEASGSSLEEVDVKLDSLADGVLDNLLAVLYRSQETLQTLHILLISPQEDYTKDFLFEAVLFFPHLVDCRIISLAATQRVRIKARDQAPQKCSPSLKVLWIGEGQPFLDSTHLLANLSSLRLDFALSSQRWRDLLEPASKSLKHLRMDIWGSEHEFHLPPLDFPQLQTLELRCFNPIFPPWIKIPSSSTLILRGTTHSEIPSVSTLWVISRFEFLSGRCPILTILRVEPFLRSKTAPPHEEERRKEERGNLLLEMLRQRRENVRNHFQVDGIGMIPLKTLIINFDDHEPNLISEMQSLVGEVIDLATVPAFIELEV